MDSPPAYETEAPKPPHILFHHPNDQLQSDFEYWFRDDANLAELERRVLHALTEIRRTQMQLHGEQQWGRPRGPLHPVDSRLILRPLPFRLNPNVAVLPRPAPGRRPTPIDVSSEDEAPPNPLGDLYPVVITIRDSSPEGEPLTGVSLAAVGKQEVDVRRGAKTKVTGRTKATKATKTKPKTKAQLDRLLVQQRRRDVLRSRNTARSTPSA